MNQKAGFYLIFFVAFCCKIWFSPCQTQSLILAKLLTRLVQCCHYKKTNPLIGSAIQWTGSI